MKNKSKIIKDAEGNILSVKTRIQKNTTSYDIGTSTASPYKYSDYSGTTTDAVNIPFDWEGWGKTTGINPISLPYDNIKLPEPAPRISDEDIARIVAALNLQKEQQENKAKAEVMKFVVDTLDGAETIEDIYRAINRFKQDFKKYNES